MSVKYEIVPALLMDMAQAWEEGIYSLVLFLLYPPPKCQAANGYTADNLTSQASPMFAGLESHSNLLSKF